MDVCVVTLPHGEDFCRAFQRSMGKMTTNTSLGPDGIALEVLKLLSQSWISVVASAF